MHHPSGPLSDYDPPMDAARRTQLSAVSLVCLPDALPSPGRRTNSINDRHNVATASDCGLQEH